MQTILEPQSLAITSLQELMREILARFGEDPERGGLRHTPERMERSMQYLTKAYQENPEGTLLGAMFDVAYDEMVIVKDIEMFSLCEHHLLPFFGKVHVAYIPHGKVMGLSKVPRLVDVLDGPEMPEPGELRFSLEKSTAGGGEAGAFVPVADQVQAKAL